MVTLLTAHLPVVVVQLVVSDYLAIYHDVWWRLSFHSTTLSPFVRWSSHQHKKCGKSATLGAQCLLLPVEMQELEQQHGPMNMPNMKCTNGVYVWNWLLFTPLSYASDLFLLQRTRRSSAQMHMHLQHSKSEPSVEYIVPLCQQNLERAHSGNPLLVTRPGAGRTPQGFLIVNAIKPIGENLERSSESSFPKEWFVQKVILLVPSRNKLPNSAESIMVHI